MKTLLRLSRLATVLLSFCLLSSCKKAKDGEPGKDGVKIVSRTFDVPSWVNGSSYWYKQLSMPELTADNINSAAIMVYFGTSANSWQAMPCTVVNTTDYFWNFTTAVNLVEARWEYNGIGNGSSPNSFYGVDVKLKVVIIPPAMIKDHPEVNLKDYSEVEKVFGESK